VKWLLIVFGSAANAAASILVKYNAYGAGGTKSIFHGWINPVIALAVASYGLAFVLYSLALARLPLNVAHPIMTVGAIVVVGLFSFSLFKEPVSARVLIGYAMLLGGIMLLSSGIDG
jgi:multidrug transporter EmrE-like cation transporter